MSFQEHYPKEAPVKVASFEFARLYYLRLFVKSLLLDGDGFGQVPGLVDVVAALDCHVVGEELERDVGQ